jgi:hypothetical protein
MKIRILKSFNGYKTGQVFEWGDGMARVFIARGLAAPVEAPVEAAAAEVAAERAEVPLQLKRRAK